MRSQALLLALALACRPDVADPPAPAAAPPPRTDPPAATTRPPPADRTDVDRTLAGGIDRPLPATPDPVTPDRVCTAATPGGHGLTPEVTCACGDVLACAVTRRDDALELVVHRVPAPQLCDDCYPSRTTCTLPRLKPGEQLRLVHAARDLGRLTADPAGWLPAGTCLPP